VLPTAVRTRRFGDSIGKSLEGLLVGINARGKFPARCPALQHQHAHEHPHRVFLSKAEASNFTAKMAIKPKYNVAVRRRYRQIQRNRLIAQRRD
jgi:hypothetical protein